MEEKFAELKDLVMQLKHEDDSHLKIFLHNEIVNVIADLEDLCDNWNAFERDLMS